MIDELSILIPTHNDTCLPQVRALVGEAESIKGLQYEIIVADDASTDKQTIDTNKQILALPHCRYIQRQVNVGRAAIRNFLAKEAKYRWLLFIDSNINIPNADFLQTYLSVSPQARVIDGGVQIDGDTDALRGNLRYRYEKKAAPRHTAVHRNSHPYQSFRTTNFVAQKDIFNEISFNSNIRTYGYEDVLFGKHLEEHGISIIHINNPVAYQLYEDNGQYMKKMTEAIQTLHMHSHELVHYSPLLRMAHCIEQAHLALLCNYIYKKMSRQWLHNLHGNHPSLIIFSLFKLFYLISIRRAR